jgi:hypothetical protein
MTKTLCSISLGIGLMIAFRAAGGLVTSTGATGTTAAARTGATGRPSRRPLQLHARQLLTSRRKPHGASRTFRGCGHWTI